MDTTRIRAKAEQWKYEHPNSPWRFATFDEILALCDEVDRLNSENVRRQERVREAFGMTSK